MKKSRKPPRNIRKKRPKRKPIPKTFNGFNNEGNFPTDSDSDEMFEDLEMSYVNNYEEDDDDDFRFPRGDPSFEIHSGSNVSVESIKPMKKPAWKLAGNHAVAKFKGADAGIFLDYVPLLQQFPNLKLRLQNLFKIVLIDNGKKGWAVEFHYVPEQGPNELVEFNIPPFTGAHSRENADKYVIQVIADLIVDYGKKHPKKSVHGCAFLLDDVVCTYSRQKIDLLKSAVKADAEHEDTGEFSFDDANDFFKQLQNDMGGTIVSEKVAVLDYVERLKLDAFVCLSLLNGERCWPFLRH